MPREPKYEGEVITLFLRLADFLGWQLTSLSGSYPDAEFLVDGTPTRVEFELASSGFKGHAHQDPKLCDVIVCWEHDAWHWDPWLHKDTTHIRIVELKHIFDQTKQWLYLSPSGVEAEREEKLERFLARLRNAGKGLATDLYRELHERLRKIPHLTYGVSSEKAERVQVSWWDIDRFWHRPIEFLVVHFNRGWLRLDLVTTEHDVNLRDLSKVPDALAAIQGSIEQLRRSTEGDHA
jgi:hypothetical protein